MEYDDYVWVERVDLTDLVRQKFPIILDNGSELEEKTECHQVRQLPLLKRFCFHDAPRIFKGGKVSTAQVFDISEPPNETKYEIRDTKSIENDLPGRILIAEPLTVEFHNFQLGKQYKRIIMIRNVSSEIARYQLAKRIDATKLKLILQTKKGNREDLAAGMSASLTLLFKAKTPESYTENIIIHVKNGFPIVINISAYRDPPILIGGENCSGVYLSSANLINTEDNLLLSYLERPSSPKRGSLTHLLDEGELECNKCLVGEEKLIEMKLINLGSSGHFFMISETNWHSRNIVHVTEENRLVSNCFILFPAYFHLNKNQSMILKTYFTPNTQGFHVEKIYLICDNFSVKSIEIMGDAIMFNWDFIYFGSNLRRESFCLTEMEENKFCNFFIVELNHVDFVQITVSNLSEFDINFRWEIVNEICLSIVPQSGIFPAFTTLIFRISSRNKYLCSQFVESNLQLFIEDLPYLSIPEEYRDFTEECKNRRRNCDFSVDICVANVSVRLPSTSSSIISDDTFSSEGM